MYKPKRIYVIVGHGISDIGKGWLMSAIGMSSPKTTLPIKIDPFFSLKFPEKIGKPITDLCDINDIKDFVSKTNLNPEEYIISDDFIQYKNVGMKVLPECNILGGSIFQEFLEQERDEKNLNRSKKTFADISHFLAKKITQIANKTQPETLLIEVGGTIEDNEQVYISGALRLLSSSTMLGTSPEILLLTYFDYSEVNLDKLERIKTRYIQQGIRTVQEKFFGLNFKMCFVRRRNIPNEVIDLDLEAQLDRIIYETQFDSKKVTFLPNVKWNDLNQITVLLKKLKLI
jgi:CTP synthase